MELSIFSPKEPELKPEPEKRVCLKLEQIGKSVRVVACNPDTGKTLPSGNLIEFSPCGRIFRSQFIDRNLGFDLFSDGSIKEE